MPLRHLWDDTFYTAHGKSIRLMVAVATIKQLISATSSHSINHHCSSYFDHEAV